MPEARMPKVYPGPARVVPTLLPHPSDIPYTPGVHRMGLRTSQWHDEADVESQPGSRSQRRAEERRDDLVLAGGTIGSRQSVDLRDPSHRSPRGTAERDRPDFPVLRRGLPIAAAPRIADIDIE